MAELKDLVPDAELFLPAFNVVTGRFQELEAYAAAVQDHAVIGKVHCSAPDHGCGSVSALAPCWATCNRGLAVRRGTTQSRDRRAHFETTWTIMSEYKGMVFGTVGEVSKGVAPHSSAH